MTTPAIFRGLALYTKRLGSTLRRLAGGGGRSWEGILGWLQEATPGAWQRNETVSVETGLSNPTLYSTVTLIAKDVGKLRPKLVEQDSDGIWHEVDSSAFSPVIRKPNHYQNRIQFYVCWILSRLNYGMTYALKQRDGRGVVSALHILDPCRVTPLVAPDTSVFYELATDDLAGFEGPITVPAREMIADVYCPLFHPLIGVSPLYAAAYPALQGLTIRTQSHRFFSVGGKPGGILTAPGDVAKETAERIKADWVTNFTGENVGKIAILGNGLSYQALAVTAEQSQLVLQAKMSDEDIVKCYHMPRHKVGVGPDPTYNNIEALTLQYYEDCLQYHIESLELCLDEGLELTKVPGKILGVEFDIDNLFRMDTATQVKTAREAIQAGASPNEVRRRWLNLGRTAGGDTPFMQEQNWPISQLAARELPARPPTPPAPLALEGESEPEAKDLDLVREIYRKHLAA